MCSPVLTCFHMLSHVCNKTAGISEKLYADAFFGSLLIQIGTHWRVLTQFTSEAVCSELLTYPQCHSIFLNKNIYINRSRQNTITGKCLSQFDQHDPMTCCNTNETDARIRGKKVSSACTRSANFSI